MSLNNYVWKYFDVSANFFSYFMNIYNCQIFQETLEVFVDNRRNTL